MAPEESQFDFPVVRDWHNVECEFRTSGYDDDGGDDIGDDVEDYMFLLQLRLAPTTTTTTTMTLLHLSSRPRLVLNDTTTTTMTVLDE